jgi:hypothetical protein
VPREDPFSKSSTVEPASAVPVSVKLEPTFSPSAGDEMTGAAGARASTRVTTTFCELALSLPTVATAESM